MVDVVTVVMTHKKPLHIERSFKVTKSIKRKIWNSTGNVVSEYEVWRPRSSWTLLWL